MKQFSMTTTERKGRLRQRLGLPTKRWSVRIKPGGWIKMPAIVVRSLGLKVGDAIKWESTSKGLEVRRIPHAGPSAAWKAGLQAFAVTVAVAAKPQSVPTSTGCGCDLARRFDVQLTIKHEQ